MYPDSNIDSLERRIFIDLSNSVKCKIASKNNLLVLSTSLLHSLKMIGLSMAILSTLAVASCNQNLVHMYVDAGSRRCFYKDLSKESVLLGRYRMEIYNAETNTYEAPKMQNSGILVDVEEVFDSNQRVVHQRGSASGLFSFSALETGEHRVCLTPKSFYKRTWKSDPAELKESKFTRARLTLDLGIGTHHGDIGVEALASRVNALIDKLTDIKREQDFIRKKEMLFRDMSERVCERVVRWLIIQIVAYTIACLFQLRMLLRFFMKHKTD